MPSSEGPTLPVDPAAERAWQPPHPALVNTLAPAVASPVTAPASPVLVCAGVVSEADILAKEGDEPRGGGFLRWLVDPGDPWIRARFDAVTVGEAMSTPAQTITPDRPITEAATIMLDEGVNRLPVIDTDRKLVGLVSRGDVVRAFARPDDEILEDIEEDVIRKAMWLDPNTLDVTVTNGVVALAGEVATAADAEIVSTLTRKVPGVVSVNSSLTYRL